MNGKKKLPLCLVFATPKGKRREKELMEFSLLCWFIDGMSELENYFSSWLDRIISRHNKSWLLSKDQGVHYLVVLITVIGKVDWDRQANICKDCFVFLQESIILTDILGKCPQRWNSKHSIFLASIFYDFKANCLQKSCI